MARLDDLSDPTAYGQSPVGFAGPDPSTLTSSGNAQGIDYGGAWTPAAGLHSSANSPFIDYGGSWSQNPVSALPPTDNSLPVQSGPNSGGFDPTGGGNGSSHQGGGGGGGSNGMQTQTQTQTHAAPIHHRFQEFLDNGQAVTDSTFVNQKAALLNKLNEYRGNVAKQVGEGNLFQATDPEDKLMGSHWAMKGLGTLYNTNKDINGDINYTPTDVLHGGSLGSEFNNALGAFNNQQSQGLRGLAEDYAARGMLGAGSGVWQTANKNLSDRYNTQLQNLNDSTVGTYNNLVAGLGDQTQQGRLSLNGWAGDAANRIADRMNSGLPTSV